MYLYPI